MSADVPQPHQQLGDWYEDIASAPIAIAARMDGVSPSSLSAGIGQ